MPSSPGRVARWSLVTSWVTHSEALGLARRGTPRAWCVCALRAISEAVSTRHPRRYNVQICTCFRVWVGVLPTHRTQDGCNRLVERLQR